MKFKLHLNIGEMGLEIEDEAEGFADFVKKMDCYSGFPSTGPSGETDLKFTYRTPKGFKYYSVACPSAGMEMRLHWYKDRPGEFYTQGWTKITYGDAREEAGELQEPPTPAGPLAGELRKAVEAIPQAGDDPDREAFDQELKHREADAELKRLFLTAKGKTEKDWRAYYNQESVADWPLATKLAKIESGKANLQQRTATRLRTIIAELGKHVGGQAIENRIASICVGEYEIERLKPAEQAKALKSLEAWLEELQARSQRRTA